MNIIKFTKILIVPLGLISLLTLSACQTTQEKEGWIKNGFAQWHPQTGGPSISSTGTQCYFCGNGLDSDGDGIFDHLDKCPNTPKGVEVDAQGCPFDSDGDGVLDYMDKCPNTPKGIQVDDFGCPLDSDHDGVIDNQDQCPNTPAGAKVNAQGCWVLDNLNFQINKAIISPMAYPTLDAVITVLNNNPNVQIEIHGHTDSTGRVAYNDKLANKRAKAVMNYLVEHGIDANRLTAASFGLHQPIASNDDEAGRALNRRVELKPRP